MRVRLDTNVLISALSFPSGRMTKLFESIVVNHMMVLCSYVIDELHQYESILSVSAFKE